MVVKVLGSKVMELKAVGAEGVGVEEAEVAASRAFLEAMTNTCR